MPGGPDRPVCPAARYVRLPGCPVCPAARYVRLSGMPGCPVCPAVRLFDGALRVEGSPTPAFRRAAGGFAPARRAMARDGVHKHAQVVGCASSVACEALLGDEFTRMCYTYL